MRLDRVDPLDLDLATAQQLAAVHRAEIVDSGLDVIAPSAEGILGQIRYGSSNRPVTALWLVRSDPGTLVGHATLEVHHWDNPALAMVFGAVRPEARGTGVGTALLDAQVATAREHGRSVLLTFAPQDGHAARFLAAHGFEVGQQNAQRRLLPQRVDYGQIATLAADAADHAADYELVRLAGAAPEEMLPGLVSLFEAINDAPTDGLTLDPDVYPVERARAYELAMSNRRQQVYRLMARHRRTGEWAGHTILCVDETRPGHAVQEDTSVVATHRGQRLGMALKASMLLWMHEIHPELTTIDTWNATSNVHMIAVNDALGCEVSMLGVAMQRSL